MVAMVFAFEKWLNNGKPWPFAMVLCVACGKIFIRVAFFLSSSISVDGLGGRLGVTSIY